MSYYADFLLLLVMNLFPDLYRLWMNIVRLWAPVIFDPDVLLCLLSHYIMLLPSRDPLIFHMTHWFCAIYRSCTIGSKNVRSLANGIPIFFVSSNYTRKKQAILNLFLLLVCTCAKRDTTRTLNKQTTTPPLSDQIFDILISLSELLTIPMILIL